MQISKSLAEFSMARYRLLAVLAIIFTVITGALIPMITVDTDPENMLSEDEAVRVFHRQTEDRFDLSDIVVLGVINETHPEGVFNVSSLNKIYELTEYTKQLTWQRDGVSGGVIAVDLMAPSTVDHIEQGDMPGVVSFQWLMPNPPADEADALLVRDRFLSNPIFENTLISDNGKALCIYIPITSKSYSYNVYKALREKIADYSGDEKYYITGLPVAQDTFGVEMFVQMAISAPMEMLIIFFLMLAFFRKLVLIILPLIIAMISVITTMGIMIGLGFPVHIMSSMIPIFLMPIAVVDSVHILSEFFDIYSKSKGRKETIREVMDDLFAPMLYTSLTSAAGFASLGLTPIPPVQVFGVFVAIGIMIAWVSTILLTPAYIMFIKDKSLAGFGHSARTEEKASWLAVSLQATGRFTYKNAKLMLVGAFIIAGLAIYGITKIEINDNPVKWFSKNHPIRQADIELNKHFGGTYMAYLVLDAKEHNVDDGFLASVNTLIADEAQSIADYFDDKEAVNQATQAIGKSAASLIPDYKNKPIPEFLKALAEEVLTLSDKSEGELSDIFYELSSFLELEMESSRIFKQPETLRYIADFQKHIATTGLVGKSNSVADIVQKVHQELIDGSQENFRIPDSVSGVSQCLMQYQSSHRPQDLWRFVTYDFMGANIWLQLVSGDNKDMESVVAAVDDYFTSNPPPEAIEYNWAGMTYINTVWQDKMVWGMLQSFLGSFIIVFIMMSVLFRSPLWGLICMLPLTITIVVIYGVIGFVGKDYDMPVAVLSALTLGMAVDFAIHFLSRARTAYQSTGSWEQSSEVMFGEPARAIARNVLVIAIGFLPLLAAPLMPYKTVGILLCAIMLLSGAVTLLILPPIIKLAQKKLFKDTTNTKPMKCSCIFCVVVSIATVVLVAVNLAQYWNTGFTKLAAYSAVAIVVLAAICSALSRRNACKTGENK